MPTFDGEALIITLDSGVTEIDSSADLYKEWKLWALDGNLRFPEALQTSGGEDVIPGSLSSGAYFFLQNQHGWRIRPPEEDINIAVTGNLIAADNTLPIIIPTIGDFTVLITGLQPITQSVAPLNEKISHIEQWVWIDTSLLVNGDGSQKNPFNNVTVAIDYAEAENIRHLHVMDDLILDRQLKNFTIAGVGLPTIDTNGQDLTGCRFYQTKMDGTYIGEIIAQECVLLSNFYLNGFFEKNGLAGDLFCVDGANILMAGNFSVIAGLGRPSVNMTSTLGVSLSMREIHGGMTIKGCDHADSAVTAEVAEGSLTFDASNTTTVLNSMIARGDCLFLDQVPTAGVVKNETSRVLTWSHLIEAGFTAEEIMRVQASAMGGDASGLDTNNPIYKALNGTKPRIATTGDGYGNRTGTVIDASY